MSVWFFTRAMCKNVPLRQNLIPRATAYLPERHVRVADVHGDIDYEIMIASQSESLCAWFVGPALALRRIVSLSRDGRAVHGDVASLCRLARCTLLRLDPNCCLSCKQRTVSAPGDSWAASRAIFFWRPPVAHRPLATQQAVSIPMTQCPPSPPAPHFGCGGRGLRRWDLSPILFAQHYPTWSESDQYFCACSSLRAGSRNERRSRPLVAPRDRDSALRPQTLQMRHSCHVMFRQHSIYSLSWVQPQPQRYSTVIIN